MYQQIFVELLNINILLKFVRPFSSYTRTDGQGELIELSFA